MSDEVPPGLQIIDCTSHLKLQAMQILGEEDNRLVEANSESLSTTNPKD